MTLLEAHDISVEFPVAGARRTLLRAVDRASITIASGEIVAVVGESGCGKTTLARALLGLAPIAGGSIVFAGQPVDPRSAADLRRLRKRVQMVFQDPFDSLNPRKTVFATLAQPLRAIAGVKRADRRRAAARLLDLVGLSPGETFLDRYPHQFSGGQRQRIGIARAIAVEPRLVIADEAVSALDISIRAQILTVLARLRRVLGLSYLFITHDLGVVRSFADRVVVMYLGRIVEVGATEALFATPAHPYTAALIAACPVPDPTAARAPVSLQGDVPSPLDPPKGCRFHTRCAFVQDVCRRVEPAPTAVDENRRVACHFPRHA
ncbi:MAG: ABC transporter ATP-binding protein [Alphaproteobacteria bacterium]|nr:ABC transporter ATP-binding protein [Alphaproteobacteria bacterium]